MKKKLISKNIFMQTSLWKKATGLMFRKKMKDFAMIFPFRKETKISITMLFVFYKIDVVILNSSRKIIATEEGLKPFHNYYFKKKAHTFIELPKGYLKKFKLKKGSDLDWDKKALILLK